MPRPRVFRFSKILFNTYSINGNECQLMQGQKNADCFHFEAFLSDGKWKIIFAKLKFLSDF